MTPSSSIFIAGHRGLVGSAITRALESQGFSNLLFQARSQLNLADLPAVDSFFSEAKPEFVFLAAAKVGGIFANSTQPADFIRENLAIQLNVIDSAHRHGVKKLLFLGSSCIYPKLAPQPLKEEYLLTGPLDPTNEPYAIAKIAGIKLCQSYRTQFGFNAISLMPTNLYGPGDNFDPQNSHVVPALIRRFHEARLAHVSEVTLWGTGSPRREFLHVDDLASAAIFLMQRYDDPAIVNVGTGEDLTVAELAKLTARTVRYQGDILWDSTKPDGPPRKLLDVTRLHSLSWRHHIPLEAGLESTYNWYLRGDHSPRPMAHAL